AGFDEPLRPAALLRLESVHLHRHFSRLDEIGHEHETPSAKLRAIAEIEVLGERVVLPPAGIADRFAAPHAGGAVEIEKPAGPISYAMLEHEVNIEQNRLNIRQ